MMYYVSFMSFPEGNELEDYDCGTVYKGEFPDFDETNKIVQWSPCSEQRDFDDPLMTRSMVGEENNKNRFGADGLRTLWFEGPFIKEDVINRLKAFVEKKDTYLWRDPNLLNQVKYIPSFEDQEFLDQIKDTVPSKRPPKKKRKRRPSKRSPKN